MTTAILCFLTKEKRYYNYKSHIYLHKEMKCSIRKGGIIKID